MPWFIEKPRVSLSAFYEAKSRKRLAGLWETLHETDSRAVGFRSHQRSCDRMKIETKIRRANALQRTLWDISVHRAGGTAVTVAGDLRRHDHEPAKRK